MALSRCTACAAPSRRQSTPYYVDSNEGSPDYIWFKKPSEFNGIEPEGWRHVHEWYSVARDGNPIMFYGTVDWDDDDNVYVRPTDKDGNIRGSNDYFDNWIVDPRGEWYLDPDAPPIKWGDGWN